MKILIKRILSTILVFLILSGQVSFSAVFEDLLDDSPYANYVKVLSALSVINADEDGLFNPDRDVTRAEFVSIIVSMLGMDEVRPSSTETAYSDVGGDYWAAAEIKVASELKIIGGNGDGTFSPDDAITVEQAVKAVLSMTGYDFIAIERGGFPTGYLSLANEKRLFSGLALDYSQKLLRKDMAVLLFNALSLNVIKSSYAGNKVNYYITEGDTLLSYHLHVKKAEKVKVTATSATSLTGTANMKDDEILIGGTIFKIGYTNAADYLGYNVTVYYKDNKDTDTKTLLIVMPERSNSAVRILSEDIAGCVDNVFSYNLKTAAKARTIEISPAIDVVYNGVKFPDYTNDTFVPETGDVTFLDNNGDTVYDIAFINSYENITIGAIDYEEYKIYDYYNQGRAIIIEPTKKESYKIIRQSDGEILAFDDLSVNDLISVKTSADDQYIEIILCTEIIKGRVDEIFDNKVVIDEKEYTVIKSLNNSRNNIKLGYEGVFYFNVLGEIAHFSADDAGRLKYGYFIDMQKISAMDASYTLKFLAADNTVKIFKLASKIELNGQLVKKGDAVVAAFKTDYATGNLLTEYLRQPFIYSLNNSDEIIMIDTAIVQNEEDKDTLNLGLVKGQQTFKTSIKSFGLKFVVADSTVIFRVPSVAKAKPDDEEFDVVKPNVFLQDSKYVVEPYNLSDGNVAKIMVYYVTEADLTATWDSSFALVDRITETVDEKGTQTSKLYCLANGQYMSFLAVSPAVLNPGRKLKRGDGVRITLDKNRKIANVLLDFDSARPYDNQTKGAILDSLYEFNGVVYGSDAGNLVVSNTTAQYISDIDFNGGTNLNIRPNGHIYIYDEELNTISNGTVGDIMDYKNSGEAASRVFARLTYERCRELVILKLKK